MALAALGPAACYVYTPLYTAPVPGTRVSFELNDRGRAALEEHVGPEVASVDGVLGSVGDTALVMQVTEVHGLHGSLSHWTGESVVFRPDYIRSMSARRFSGGRTAVLLGALASGSLAFVATRTLLGGAGDDGGGGVTPPPPGH